MTTAISLLCSAAIACTVPAILPASTAPSYSTPPIATEAPAVSEDFTVLEQEMLDLINDARETAGLPPAQANDALQFSDDEFRVGDRVVVQIRSFVDEKRWLRGKIRGKL